MKAAAVTLVSLAAPALALASAIPGQGFRILRRADVQSDCKQATRDAEAKCRQEQGGAGFDTCYLVGQDADMACAVDNDKGAEASDAVHLQCRAESVKSARSCFDVDKQAWGACRQRGLTAYPDCVKRASANGVPQTPGQSQGPAGTAASTSTDSGSGGCPAPAQPPTEAQAAPAPAQAPESPQVMEDKLCATTADKPNKYGVDEQVCRRNVRQCAFENPKAKNFDPVIKCVDDRAKTTGLV